MTSEGLLQDPPPTASLQTQQETSAQTPPAPPDPGPARTRPIEIAQFVFVVVGAMLVIAQLWSDADARKTDRTLDFAQRFNEERLGQARRDLIKPWFAYTAEIQEFNKSGVDESVLDNFVREVVRNASKDNPERDLRLAIYDMADFFDQLALCIDAERCDGDVAQKYFGPFAKDFYCLYGVVIRDLRKDLSVPHLGAGLQIFVPADACYAP